VEANSKVLARKLVDGRLVFTARIRRRDLAAVERVCSVRLLPARP
jgi:hypothetical protein